MSGNLELPLIQRARQNMMRRAIIAKEGEFTYQQLLNASNEVSSCLLDGSDDLKEMRVAFLIPPGFHYAAVQWGIWRAGGIAVPLSLFHPRPELEYTIKDTDAAVVLAHPDLESSIRPLAQDSNRRFVLTTDVPGTEPQKLPEIDVNRRAMILYTSGTTGKPKGVVTTHTNIEVQVKSLVSAWEWSPQDHILGVLPLNHIHGIVNVLTCALWSGATCEILSKFDAEGVWARILDGNLTLFMAVPTIYVKLIACWEDASSKQQREMSAACSKLRLMVSGSAALPVDVLKKWKHISGHVLLERYGMTEIGMALSNPLHGKRIPGYVGKPLPGIQVRLVNERGELAEPGEQGEIQVKGDGVFLEYWRKPDATQNAFDKGWFCTGDTAVVNNGIYRILGRSSLDIIKTGGYKVSALEIEEMLRTHPDIEECAVVGVEDPVWGERVSVALVLKAGKGLTFDSLKKWSEERLAKYKIPNQILVLKSLPRNEMGKVSKPEVSQLFKDTNKLE
jgi:malonyl-CoA/methylmalonyl-CoA synthetase